MKDDDDLIGDARNLEGRDGFRKGNGSYSQPQCSETASVNINHVNILVFFFCLPFLYTKICTVGPPYSSVPHLWIQLTVHKNIKAKNYAVADILCSWAYDNASVLNMYRHFFSCLFPKECSTTTYIAFSLY